MLFQRLIELFSRASGTVSSTAVFRRYCIDVPRNLSVLLGEDVRILCPIVWRTVTCIIRIFVFVLCTDFFQYAFSLYSIDWLKAVPDITSYAEINVFLFYYYSHLCCACHSWELLYVIRGQQAVRNYHKFWYSFEIAEKLSWMVVAVLVLRVTLYM